MTTFELVHALAFDDWTQRVLVLGRTLYVGVLNQGVFAFDMASYHNLGLVAKHQDFIRGIAVVDGLLVTMMIIMMMMMMMMTTMTTMMMIRMMMMMTMTMPMTICVNVE